MANFSVLETLTQEKITELFGKVDIHPLTLQLLAVRGFTTEESAKKFLNPSYEHDIGNPFDIYGMNEAVNRIVMAIQKGEKIAIYSDYDCDGIPGGVLLRTFFADIAYPVDVYIPHRHNEGYGLHKHAIDKLTEKGVMLMITVDLAITNIEEVAYAKEKGIDVIVTDHHLPITREIQQEKGKSKVKSKKKSGDEGEKGEGVHDAVGVVQVVPEAVAVINSKQDVCTYQDDMLCGCAVAWKLVCALLITLRNDAKSKKQIIYSEEYARVLKAVSQVKDGYEKWLLDLVGISTIADMVPLQKENRALAYFGLKVLRQTKRIGLQGLFRAQGVSKEYITEEDIAFTIAPRINAASRMGDPIQAHNMLFEKDPILSEKYLVELEDLNTERKAEVKDIVSGITFDHAVYGNDVIVVGNKEWGPGILGLVAQKIIDETGKPTFVWGQGEENKENSAQTGDERKILKGSCRSRGDVHVVDLMARVQELFPGIIIHSGGHEQAGGFSCDEARVEELSHALNTSLSHIEIKDIGNQEVIVDAYMKHDDVTLTTYSAIQALAPYGVGNRKPLFAFVDVTPLSVRWFGKKSEHIEAIYPKSKGEVKAIMFFASKEMAERLKHKHTLLAHVEKSMWRGKIELRLRIVDIA